VRKKAVFIAGLTALCFLKGAVLEAASVDAPVPLEPSTGKQKLFTPRIRKPGQKLRVLSFNGGGVRVIIQLLILEDVVKRTGKQVPELFDLIAGTSAGAGNAALYAAKTPDGKHLYRADEVVELILQQYKESHIPTWHIIKTLYGLIGPRYPTKPYRERTQKILKETMLCDASPPLVIPVCDAITHETILLTTKNAKRDPKQNFKLSDVAGAAMAFPGAVEPIRMKTQSGENRSSLRFRRTPL
jgi:patatin-like phospholipase/acyl hydrolase